MSNRDIHFTKFGRLVGKELYDNGLVDLNHAVGYHADELVTQIIAQRAYDLAVHILMNAPTSSLEHACSVVEAQSAIDDIPDVDKLPE